MHRGPTEEDLVDLLMRGARDKLDITQLALKDEQYLHLVNRMAETNPHAGIDVDVSCFAYQGPRGQVLVMSDSCARSR